MWNCRTLSEIPNISGTVSLIGARQAPNDSAHIGLCSDIIKITCAIIILDTLGMLQEHILALMPKVFTASARAYITTDKTTDAIFSLFFFHNFLTLMKSDIWIIDSLYKQIVSTYLWFSKNNNPDIQREQFQSFKSNTLLPQKIWLGVEKCTSYSSSGQKVYITNDVGNKTLTYRPYAIHLM